MSSDEQSDKECPLCMEAFEDDINFFPCSCQYQICRFCWHRLRTDENGLCPACRQPYPEDPVNFQPLSSAEVQKIKTEKRQKQQQQKNKLSECRKHLSAYRVLQKNLVYVIGLSQRMADADLLKKPEFFGKFGKIFKVAVGTAQNISNSSNNAQPTSHTAYITYAKTDDALRAIQAVHNLVVDGRLVKASLGTTKYCSNFLKGQSCHKQECMYLHEVADDELSFTKEDMHLGKHTECERKLHEQMNAQQTNQSQANPPPPPPPPPPPVTNGYQQNGSKNGRNRKDSHSDLPPPGFCKIGPAGKQVPAENQESSSSGRNVEKISKSESPPALSATEDVIYSSDANVQHSTHGQVDSLIGHGRAETSCNGGGAGFPRSYSEAERNNENHHHHLKHPTMPPSVVQQHNSDFSSDSKMMMTCDELERILLNSSVPPGFSPQKQTPDSVHMTSTSSTAQSARESLAPPPPPPAGSFSSFFLDLYDDLGFDPFSESSKALADMLEEEKSGQC